MISDERVGKLFVHSEEILGTVERALVEEVAYAEGLKNHQSNSILSVVV